MRISIITATNQTKYMDRVWQSVENQTFKNWEWIIVNDGSKEVEDWYKQNVGKLRETNPEVWLVSIEKNKGRFGLYARNVGAMVASYEDIVFLDDDNEWEVNHLESLVNLKLKTDKIPYCWMYLKGKKEGSDYERIKKTHFGKQGIDLGCLLWNRDLFEQYGYFKNDSQVTFDWNCIARVYYGLGPNRFECTEEPTLIFWHKRY